ncbi:hypothetical protein Emag_005477 [Eimeria magna]
MAPEDRHTTAFRTFMGQPEWRVMPFGLKGAPSTFEAIMNSIFFDMLGQGVLTYMDDVSIYAATFDEHLRLLDRVLARLFQHKMYPKLAKCKFAAQSMEYLEYRVGAGGIHPSTEKVSAIALWPTQLANETQVRQFLGTVNYCRNFEDVVRAWERLLRDAGVFVDGAVIAAQAPGAEALRTVTIGVLQRPVMGSVIPWASSSPTASRTTCLIAGDRHAIPNQATGQTPESPASNTVPRRKPSDTRVRTKATAGARS